MPRVKLPEDFVGADPKNLTVDQLNALGHHRLPVLKVIRATCLSCRGTRKAVKLCPESTCPSWPYRLGKNPFHSRQMPPEQLAAARAARLANL